VDDQRVVAAQLERPLRAPIEVVDRCTLSLPVVVSVPPLLDDGTPFPTRYWLTCPLARIRIGRLESAGGVKSAERWIDASPEIAERFEAAAVRYAIERDSLVPADADHRPSGGVGGSRRGVKCLHAHFADHRAGHDNPVGEWVAPWVEPLDCSTPCVIEGTTGNPERSREWREPK
jgi:hypothetical protein